MAFDNKVYPNRKDNRRVYAYSTAKNCSRSCRNHGSCTYCYRNRTIDKTKKELIAQDELRNINNE